MANLRGDTKDLQVRSVRRIGILALAALVGIVLFAFVYEQLATAPPEVFAAPAAVGNEPWLEINCLDSVVEEGEDFRLLVNKKFDSEWPHETMRVFWYTDPITADETDYEYLDSVRQASNGYQSEHGRMGRDFHTLEDVYPEIDETFLVVQHFSNDGKQDNIGKHLIAVRRKGKGDGKEISCAANRGGATGTKVVGFQGSCGGL